MTQENTKQSFRSLASIELLEHLSSEEKSRLANIEQMYRFHANTYYLSLIDWEDPGDPIRRLIIPDVGELEQWGSFDPSGEENFTIMPGVEHKYDSTVLLLVSNVCAGICRYCFRKRVFISRHGSIVKDLDGAVRYIQNHPEITNVLLTGGDPLILSTPDLQEIINPILEIEHVRILRIGSKIPAFNPFRIIQDPDLFDLIRRCDQNDKCVYLMTHFDHPRELTAPAKTAIRALRAAGAVLANQTPMIRGINDDADVLAALFRDLSFIGIPPYYVFQCRPASGNKHLAVPIEEAYRIFEEARSKVSGLGKRARFVMSHLTGKIEIIGLDDAHVYMKYHRSSQTELDSKFMILKRNPHACWFDDYDEVVKDSKMRNNYYSYGPE